MHPETAASCAHYVRNPMGTWQVHGMGLLGHLLVLATMPSSSAHQLNMSRVGLGLGLATGCPIWQVHMITGRLKPMHDAWQSAPSRRSVVS